MAVASSKETQHKKQPARKAFVNRILTLRPDQQRQIEELSKLYSKAKSAKEAEEIGDVVCEIMFGKSSDYVANDLGTGSTKEGRVALAKHRQYVGQQIKRHRQQLKMSQEELAMKAGIPQSHVCRLENGKHAPSYLTIERLAKALKTKPSQLDPGFDD
jgi:ribosome-binding protein aMBF1 (putative translation factor)